MAAPSPPALSPTRLLTALMVVSAAIVLIDTAFTTQSPYAAQAPLNFAAFVAMVASGVVRSRRPAWTSQAVAVFVVATFVAGQLGSGVGIALGLAFTATVIAVATLRLWVAWSLILVNAVVVFVVGMVIYQSSLLRSLIDSGASVILLCLAVVVGLLVRDLQAALDRTGSLLAQRDQAVADLTTTNQRLTESIEREKDLALAEERARAARDLHDGLGQRLTAIRMSLDYALRVRANQAALAWTEVATTRDAASAALAEMRTWVRALHPVSVAGLTASEALEAIAGSFRGTGFEVGVHITGRARPLTENESLYLYRMVQEGLTNVLRHSGATRAEFAVDVSSGLKVELRDNGIEGRTVAPVPLVEGFGLRSMRERAESMGGTFRASWGTSGLLVRAELPGPVVSARGGTALPETVAA